MKRILLFLALAGSAVAQSSGVGSNWTVVTATLQSAAVANATGSTLAVQGLGTVAITVNCTVACSGGTTIGFQVSQDGTHYQAALATEVNGTALASTVVNQGTTATIWTVPTAGMQYVQAPISNYSAGTVTVTATAVAATPPVTTMQAIEAGTWTVTGTGGTFPVTGTFWQATQPVSGTVTANQGSANATPWLVTGTGGTFPVTGTFWQATQPVSGTFWQTTQPVSIASMPSTPVTGTFWQATQPVSGTVTANQGSANATPWLVTGTGGTFPVTGTFWQTTQPVSFTMPALVAGSATIGSVKITDGTNTLQVDPCQGNAKSTANINLTASGQIVAGTSAKKTYICSIDVITATAQNIALVEGTVTTCGTGTAGMAGGTTATTGWNFAANGGLTKGNGAASVFIASNANADNVCLLSSSSGQISGSIQYVQQ